MIPATRPQDEEQQPGPGAYAGEFSFPEIGRLHYGPGSLHKIIEILASIGDPERVFVVTTRSLVEKSEHVARLEALLGSRHVGTFSGSVAHNPREVVLEAADAARAAKPDCVICLGGGSVVDLGQAATLCLAANIRRLEDFDAHAFRGEMRSSAARMFEGRLIPNIAITTTLSAAEFTGWFGLTDRKRRVKEYYGATEFMPRAIILDPEVARDTPSWLWASTGMRSFDHAIETLCSVRPSPFADALATRAIEILTTALPRAAADPTNVEALGACQIGMWLSVYSLTNVPQGMSHGSGHQLGGRCNVPHGVTSAIVLPAVMEFNSGVAAHRLALVAKSMGLDIPGLSEVEQARLAAERIRALVREMGIKPRLRDWGVAQEDLPALATESMKSAMTQTNPRPVDSAVTILELLESVY